MLSDGGASNRSRPLTAPDAVRTSQSQSAGSGSIAVGPAREPAPLAWPVGRASRGGPVGGGQSGGFRSHNADSSDTDCPDSACPTFSPRVAGQPCRASSGSSRQPGDCLGQLPARPGTIVEHPCCPGNRWPKPTALLIGQGHGPGLRQKTRLHRRRFPRKLAGTLYPDQPSCKPARFPLLPLQRPRSCRCC